MKRILSLILCILLFCSIMPMAFADEIAPPLEPIGGDASISEVEEVVWVYREKDGVTEKRLWSYTYGCWLTDWLPA